MYQWFKQLLQEEKLINEIKKQEQFLNDDEIIIKEMERAKI